MPQSAATVTASTGKEQGSLILERSSQSKSIAKPQKDLQSTKNQTVVSVAEHRDKQKPSSSIPSTNEALKTEDGLNLISSLMDVEPPKQVVNQTQAEDGSSARAQKNSKRKGSASSTTSALSDIIQDIKISPREAKVATDNIPTKGTTVDLYLC